MTNTIGLTTAHANQLLSQYGPNKLPSKQTTSAGKLLLRQVNNVLSWLLVGAAGLSFWVGDKIDGILILAILVLNTALGFYQEYKASKELEALRSLEVQNSRVLRDGHQVLLPSSGIVPGDIVILEGGDKIPADGVLTEALSISVNESALTGESVPVLKSLKSGEDELFFGTVVVAGRGQLLVKETGVKTKFGKIALNLAEVEDEISPLEKSLASLGKSLGILALVVAVLIFVVRTMQGFEFTETFFTSIALMVAAVPEGLPTIVTIILAIGVHRMYQKKALVRRMVAVESLGAATVICTDKTGTLTKNEMVVKEFQAKETNMPELIAAAVLCNSASLVLEEGSEKFSVLGDTTEGALLFWAKEQGVDIEDLRGLGKLVDEEPFDSQTRMMSVIWEDKTGKTLFAKGAPEAILPHCELSGKALEELEQEYKKMASRGLRVLALGYKKGDLKLKQLHFLGLIAIYDPPRVEVKEAIAKAKQAGIKVVMVTGDNELTAKAVAEEIGLLEDGDEILTGAQLAELSDQEFEQRIERVRVFARTAPEQKLRIIQTFQKLGEIVAVTGDGVNDSLALKQAAVGVSMGLTGTDVAKEASDIILLNDNFATLVSAIEQGRLIYSNILKVVKFLLTGNLAEVLLIAVAVIIGLPTPLLPVQILWVNFVTDGLPALALGTDKATTHLMSVPPRGDSKILSKGMVKYISFGGILIGLVVLAAFYFSLQLYGLEIARAIAFNLMVILQMILVFIIRRHHGLFSNKNLLFSAALVLGLQLLIMTVPFLRELFKV